MENLRDRSDGSAKQDLDVTATSERTQQPELYELPSPCNSEELATWAAEFGPVAEPESPVDSSRDEPVGVGLV